MNSIKTIEILKLYKNLLRYGQQLKYTDKNYFTRRIQEEFRQNKTLIEEKDIKFSFERGLTLLSKRSVV